MTGFSPVVLILEAGSNIGQHVARAFAAKGYKVALAARKLDEAENTENTINIRGDFADPSSISAVFTKVRASLGVPSVVIYNAAAVTFADSNQPLSPSWSDLARDLNVNTVSAFAAAQQAVKGFEELPEEASKTFIFTGNALNTMTIPSLLTLGIGKSGTAHMIEVAARAYEGKGFRFYYADERKADGSPAYDGTDGEAHAEFYMHLAQSKSQELWLQTFVKGLGYQRF